MFNKKLITVLCHVLGGLCVFITGVTILRSGDLFPNAPFVAIGYSLGVFIGFCSLFLLCATVNKYFNEKTK